MQDDTHRVAQRLKGVGADILSPHGHTSLGNIIEPGNQLHQGAFGRAGAADDAYGFSGTDVQRDIREGVFFCICFVFEENMVKIDPAVGNCDDGSTGSERVLFSSNT